MIILSKGNLWITFTDIYWLNILTNGDCGTEIVNYVQNTAVRQKKKWVFEMTNQQMPQLANK